MNKDRKQYLLDDISTIITKIDYQLNHFNNPEHEVNVEVTLELIAEALHAIQQALKERL